MSTSSIITGLSFRNRDPRLQRPAASGSCILVLGSGERLVCPSNRVRTANPVWDRSGLWLVPVLVLRRSRFLNDSLITVCLFACFFCMRLLAQDSNSESVPNISNIDVSIFSVSQHNEPINSTFYSHLQVNTDVVFSQIIFDDVGDAEQFAIYQFR